MFFQGFFPLTNRISERLYDLTKVAESREKSEKMPSKLMTEVLPPKGFSFF